MPAISPDLAFSIGCMAGWIALVLAVLWETNHPCHDAMCQSRRKQDIDRKWKD